MKAEGERMSIRGVVGLVTGLEIALSQGTLMFLLMLDNVSVNRPFGNSNQPVRQVVTTTTNVDK